MKVGQRLFLAVLPAVLGLLLVAALAYWGRYAHTAPELVVELAFVAAIVSLVVSWRNTRYVVERVERLAHRALTTSGSSGVPGFASVQRDALRDLGISSSRVLRANHFASADELDEIEATVTGLSTAIAAARADASKREHEALARARVLETLLGAATARFTERTQEAQLPLHILLSSPFGALNENQEEMLGAAMLAVDAIDTEVRQLQKLLQLHRGELILVPLPINLNELLRPTIAIAAARAEAAHVQLRSEISDSSPRVMCDAVHAQEALTSILLDAIARTSDAGDVSIDARESDSGHVHILVTRHSPDGAEPQHPVPSPDSLEMHLARLLLEAQGCTMRSDGAQTTVALPTEAAARVLRP